MRDNRDRTALYFAPLNCDLGAVRDRAMQLTPGAHAAPAGFKWELSRAVGIAVGVSLADAINLMFTGHGPVSMLNVRVDGVWVCGMFFGRRQGVNRDWASLGSYRRPSRTPARAADALFCMAEVVIGTIRPGLAFPNDAHGRSALADWCADHDLTECERRLRRLARVKR